MTADDALSFVLQLCCRMFGLVLICASVLVQGNSDAVRAVDEQVEWYGRKMGELEVQGMIDELYGVRK